MTEKELEVKFYSFDEIDDDSLLKYAVIVARHEDSWIFCKHKERQTYEIPGGRRESGESIKETAARELQEETGATKFSLFPICVYSVVRDNLDSMGALFYAEITKLTELDKNYEIEKILLSKALPQNLTYPQIQPHLFQKANEFLAEQKSTEG